MSHNNANCRCTNDKKCATTGYLAAPKVRMEVKLPKVSTIFPDIATTGVNEYYALQGVKVIAHFVLC